MRLPNLGTTPLPSTPNAAKLKGAAQDFEALLLEPFLTRLEDTFSAVPGAGQEMGLEGYRGLGTQALAAGIAHAGGLGIADMIVRQLLGRGTLSKGTGGAIWTKEIL
ncbi:MAG TPA: rod-binding protein [Terriglobales bacterium]